MQTSTTHCFQDLGKLPGRTRSLNSFVCNPLREVERPLTPDEHRGAALFEIEPASIHLSQVRQQLGLGFIAALHEIPNPSEQPSAGKPGKYFHSHLNLTFNGVRSS